MIEKNHNIAVLEMGAGEKGDIKHLCSLVQPDYGIITSIAEAHLESFGSKENIIKTKMELFDFIEKKKGCIFINIDDPLIVKASKHYTQAKKIFFPNNLYKQKENGELLLEIENTKTKKNFKTSIIGKHNFTNLMGAITAAKEFGISEEEIIKSIEKFQMVSGRMELWKNIENNNEIIWDCYNANKASMLAGLKTAKKSYHKNKIAILGDMREIGISSKEQHKEIIEFAQENFTELFLIGEEFYSLKKIFPSTKIHYFKNIEDFKNQKYLNYKNSLFFVKSSFGTGLYNERNFFRKIFFKI